MGRGRKRKFNPAIPAHIDQAALPQGVYWEDGRWYIIEAHPEGGRPKKRTVAHRHSRLSELHAIVECARGEIERGTLAFLDERFHRSTEFKALAPGTQKDYRQSGQAACAYVLKDGSQLGRMQVTRINVPTMQRLVETLAAGREATAMQPAIEPRPSKANHVLRYLRRLFGWGIRFGLCEHNPAKGVRQAKELAAHTMPEQDAFTAILRFAQQRATFDAHTKGSVSPYLHAVMVLAYNLRLRGAEVTDLTDAHAGEQGILARRRKGSRDNVTLWNEELRGAWAWLIEYRRRTMAAHERPVPPKPEQRRLVVSQSGTPLTKSALDSAWQRMITLAIREGVIEEAQRFSLHGLKHRGITDTEGTLADKQEAAGHKTQEMTRRYSHDVPVVKPPRRIP
ncbi:site-specific integrase [Xanthomonas oryzae]|uniref:site-specific integrase n=1 Tax=Xanthomonas oryzae TaxID=347 RepID=UPI0005CEF098|nr:integrase [Xanthomonas oryzae]AJQ86735.1 integrase [Xanthomonas oryzae pv. oryzicola]MDI9069998.1 integrase [Xanthomonas oryzae pv. oryzae]MDI9080415.1 integrase [Xanthomonas oryzae pv. oryzae]MDI9103145.1 integrase [Xanthomonas oryzae pv. oryzae]MDI9911875.1 integrase [Xanthomonas oryzae pv. oryzae]